MAYKKKKKKHGGLKFLAFLVVVGAIVTTVVMSSSTEFAQRVLGHREDRRLEHTSIGPRFEFASATLKISIGSIYGNSGTPIDITTTRDVSIDRQSALASTEVNIERTATEVAPGVDAIPFDALNTSFTEVLTKNNRYFSPKVAGQAWTRVPVEPYYYGTEIDEHYIPMRDDIVGFEFRDLPSKPAAPEHQSGFKSTIRPAVDGPTPPSAVVTSYTYELDIDTYRRVVPILATRTRFSAPPGTLVTLTIGFDEVGLLRFADVAIASSVATTLAQQLSSGGSADYHYTLEVTEISGEAVAIDVPTNVVDPPADTIPVEAAPADTIPMAAP